MFETTNHIRKYGMITIWRVPQPKKLGLTLAKLLWKSVYSVYCWIKWYDLEFIGGFQATNKTRGYHFVGVLTCFNHRPRGNGLKNPRGFHHEPSVLVPPPSSKGSKGRRREGGGLRLLVLLRLGLVSTACRVFFSKTDPGVCRSHRTVNLLGLLKGSLCTLKLS